jgi:hypothetical protein
MAVTGKQAAELSDQHVAVAALAEALVWERPRVNAYVITDNGFVESSDVYIASIRPSY